MLREIEWRVQNGPITKNIVLPVWTLFFWKFVSVQGPVIRNWFEVPTTQMTIFILSEKASIIHWVQAYLLQEVNDEIKIWWKCQVASS